MNALDGRSEVAQLAGFRQGIAVTGGDGPSIRAVVRALVMDYGRLVGESWDAQADHAEQVVAEVIDRQGLAAGRRWAQALGDELSTGGLRSRPMS